VTVALIILGVICSSVLLIFKQSLYGLAQSRLRVEAFEVARENMDNLLAQGSVGEMIDYGISEKYPAIEWETLVEPFTPPSGEKMWVRAVCSASYRDSNDQPQKVELTYWLTDVPKDVAAKILKDKAIIDSNELSLNDANMPGSQNPLDTRNTPQSNQPNVNSSELDEFIRKNIPGGLPK
jgi:type II secretory pathway pseudopilin PulG